MPKSVCPQCANDMEYHPDLKAYLCSMVSCSGFLDARTPEDKEKEIEFDMIRERLTELKDKINMLTEEKKMLDSIIHDPEYRSVCCRRQMRKGVQYQLNQQPKELKLILKKEEE